MVEFASEFQRFTPIGDRYEALAAAIADAYLNICIVHVQGGELSGSIDESPARHHQVRAFPFSEHPSLCRVSAAHGREAGDDSRGRVSIKRYRAPTLADPYRGAMNSTGSGAYIDPQRTFQLVIFHSTTTEYKFCRRLLEPSATPPASFATQAISERRWCR